MTRRNAFRQQLAAAEGAMNLLKKHPSFPNVQVDIHDRIEVLKAENGGAGADLSRESLNLKIFEIKASAYLGLVADLEHQEAYMVVLEAFARGAWEGYTGFRFEAVPPFLHSANAVWDAICARKLHWIYEGYRRLRVDKTMAADTGTLASKGPSKANTLNSASINVFVSYAHADENLHDELAKHLKPLEREGVIRPWHDRKIKAGQKFGPEIDAALNGADIILLLVTPDFVGSEYCWSKEMNRAMERHEAREARVIPIILRPVDWQQAPFGKLLALPKDGKPVTSWSDRDEAFLDIAQGIRAAV